MIELIILVLMYPLSMLIIALGHRLLYEWDNSEWDKRPSYLMFVPVINILYAFLGLVGMVCLVLAILFGLLFSAFGTPPYVRKFYKEDYKPNWFMRTVTNRNFKQ